MEKVTFKNSRNLILVGNFYPSSPENIIIMCHGFTSDKSSRGDVSSVTPISGKYKNIPFITFKSDALEETFESRFKQNYLLTSTETNILNLLLME
jgi:hypothetical protein